MDKLYSSNIEDNEIFFKRKEGGEPVVNDLNSAAEHSAQANVEKTNE